jgi:hypothetical protein
MHLGGGSWRGEGGGQMGKEEGVHGDSTHGDADSFQCDC